MKLKSLFFGSAAALMVVGGAQAADLPVAAEPVDYVRVCDAFGEGFFYIPGSETCLRVSGRVRVEAHYIEGGRDVNQFTTRARGYVRLDSRTQSDFGLVRAYVSMHMTVGPSDDENYAGTNSTLEEAFVSIQGDRGTFTAGHTGSLFNDWGSNTFGPRIGIDDPTTEATQFSYLFEGENGFSAGISIEDPASRGARISTDDDGIYGGQRYPDLVGRLGFSGDVVTAQVMGVAHHIRSDVGGVDSEWGWAAGAWLGVNVPNTNLGFNVSGAYTRGATAYVTNFSVTDAVVDTRVLANGDVVFADDMDLTRAWTVRGGLSAGLTETVTANLDASYTDIEHDQNGFVAIDDLTVWAVAGNVIWEPIAGLQFGAELAYNNVDVEDGFDNDDDDDDIWGGMIRVQRSF